MSSAKKSGADARMIAIPEHVVARELHSEVASKPIGRLHEDGLCAIRCEADMLNVLTNIGFGGKADSD